MMTGPVIVHNGRDQTIRFDGEVLAFASTYAPGRGRWTEVVIYRSTTGEYIVSKIGRSTVVHLASSQCRRSHMLPFDRTCEPPPVPYVSCCKCRVNPHDDIGLVIERDLFAAKISQDARGAVAACYSKDKNGLFYLIEPAERALEAAGALDDDLWHAYMNLDPASLRDCMATR